MSYEKKRIEYLKHKDDFEIWDEVDASYDESWLKIRNLANSYNSSVKIGIIDYIDNLHTDDFLYDDLIYGMYEFYTKEKLNRVYFKTIPTTFPDLLKYIMEYQKIVTVIHPKMETYILDNGFLIPSPISKEKPIEENIEKIVIIKRTEIPSKSSESDFKEAKDFRAIYDKARSYRPKLFWLYLDGLIKSIADKYPKILQNVPYDKTGYSNEETTQYKGRKDFMTTHDGLFILIDKARTKSINTDEYVNSNIKQIFDAGFIKKQYSSSAVGAFIRTSESKDILEYLIEQSVIDICPYEDTFAVDGTGFSGGTKNDYYAQKHHNGKKEIEWVNLQAFIPVKSALITNTYLYYKYESSENEGVIPLIKQAFKLGYNVKNLTADKLYGGKDLREKIHNLGVEKYYCEFKDNVKSPDDSDNSQWAIEYRFWKDHEDEFYSTYHKRSNVESAIGAVKKLGDERLTRKTIDGFFKEVLAKVILYNIYGMITQLFLNGIVPHYLKKEDILNEINQ